MTTLIWLTKPNRTRFQLYLDADVFLISPKKGDLGFVLFLFFLLFLCSFFMSQYHHIRLHMHTSVASNDVYVFYAIVVFWLSMFSIFFKSMLAQSTQVSVLIDIKF